MLLNKGDDRGICQVQWQPDKILLERIILLERKRGKISQRKSYFY